MISIPLTSNSPLSHTISYSVSPLFELAASLHTLAQLSPPARFNNWSQDLLAQFKEARLSNDWEYFLPLFRYGIPDSFDPVITRGVMSVDDQYEYFVTLPSDDFVRRLQPLLKKWNQHHDIPSVAFDIEEDADYVKGRFSLFVSSYWQLFFEANWEAIAPSFVREAEQIHHVLNDLPACLDYLNKISFGITYDSEENRLLCPYEGPDYEVQQLVLYPSHFYAAEPLLSKGGAGAHLLYSFL
ncbi:hypothetical protein BRE01_64630 [Brevibacillus reuszeri]|uniref:Uncharacterized protein n=1 Tax=Brevibacillus reuszeri TaxID=54915 RepID=A0A0K9YW43_9BACL|nr:hypothetical protein [Brevibacillus reuszeri]KNB72891.1 hypothetical protein ADS79_13745 [Brevibacillus reuszeri]MED1861749.1 hypothetical protein [Brevibacillus reuszeri]GED72761.1 hypothetical protein BRE01_64630 [Brevibacillus reuszeri]